MVVWGRRGGGGGEERPRRCGRPSGGGGPSGGAPRRSTGTAPGSGSCCYSPENREEHLGQLFFSLSFFRFLLYIHTFISFISHEYSCNIHKWYTSTLHYVHTLHIYVQKNENNIAFYPFSIIFRRKYDILALTLARIFIVRFLVGVAELI